MTLILPDDAEFDGVNDASLFESYDTAAVIALSAFVKETKMGCVAICPEALLQVSAESEIHKLDSHAVSPILAREHRSPVPNSPDANSSTGS